MIENRAKRHIQSHIAVTGPGPLSGDSSFKHPPLAFFGDFSCASSAGRAEGQEAQDNRKAPNFHKICAGLNMWDFQHETCANV